MDKVDVEEKKKMFDLMKDRELGGNMDWMYRGDKPDTEEFLLGKSVDKLVAEATTVEEGSGSIISERIKANVALDMQAKMREDPLFAIRKKEEDARRRLLENPVKMKQLEKLVEQQQQKQKASKKAKKEKKSKKKKKKKSKDSDSDSDSSGSEDDLVNKYLTILTNKQKSGGAATAGNASSQPKKRHNNNTGADDSRRYDSRNKNDERHRHRDDRGQNHKKSYQNNREQERYRKRTSPSDRADRHVSQSPAQKRQRKRSDSSDQSEPELQVQRRLQRPDNSDGEGEISKRVYGLIKNVRNSMASAEPSSTEDKMKSYPTKKSRSPSPPRSRSRSPNRSSHRKEPRRHRSPPRHYRSHKRPSPSSSRSPSPARKRTSSAPKRQRSQSKSPPRKQRSRTPPKRKLTAEEKQKKLQEMMDDAKWRDEQRQQNVQRYKHEDQKESSRLSTYQGDPTFLSSMMFEHAAGSSVEDRIKRNKHNIQRTRAALDKNFTQQ